MKRYSVAVLLLIATIAACDDTAPRGPGSLFVNSSAAIFEPTNLFAYRIAVDGGTPRDIYVFENDTLQLNGMAPGAHTVEMTGLPPVCSAGELKRTVSLKGDDTAKVVFNVVCQRTTGDVRVSVATTGSDLDIDGYLVHLNGLPRSSVSTNGQTTIQYILPGTASVSLSGLAANCTPNSASQSVTIVAGVLATVNLGVTCTATGNVKTVVSVTGTDPDPDGVTIKLGTGTAARVAMGTGYMRVNPGQQTYEIGDVQPNCTLSGASSGTFTAAAGDTITINASLTCAAVGYGTATTVATDAANDTLSNAVTNVGKAHDVVQITTRYAPNWLILVMRFARPVGSVGGSSQTALQGYIELDTDENVSTGFEPTVNGYGGNAQQGVDYGILLFSAVGSYVPILKASTTTFDSTTHRVPLALEGDSVVVKIPLAKLGPDDGNLSLTALIGTYDRPTDLAPNTGQILGRAPAPVIAAAVQGVAPKKGGKRGYELKWKKQ